MSTLDDARMPSLKDKLLAQAEADADEALVEEKKGKGRIRKSRTKN